MKIERVKNTTALWYGFKSFFNEWKQTHTNWFVSSTSSEVVVSLRIKQHFNLYITLLSHFAFENCEITAYNIVNLYSIDSLLFHFYFD